MIGDAGVSQWDFPMEIKGPGRVEAAAVRRVAKSATGTGSSFLVSDAPETRGSVVAGPGPIGALDSILMLQGLDDSTDGRSKATAHGEALLDMLDQVRDGLLAGGVPRATLNRLANAVTRRHDQFNDPKLQGVLDEIELRAHVELAKLEMMDKRVA
jgi:Class II flagellar assembly regulator